MQILILYWMRRPRSAKTCLLNSNTRGLSPATPHVNALCVRDEAYGLIDTKSAVVGQVRIVKLLKPLKLRYLYQY